MLVPVKFKIGVAPYNAGEVAGFPPEVAARFIEQGIAEALLPATQAEATISEPRTETVGSQASRRDPARPGKPKK